METVEVGHPDKLYGRPDIPELKMEAWYVLAADVREEIDARGLPPSSTTRVHRSRQGCYRRAMVTVLSPAPSMISARPKMQPDA